jgi:hypothetical protein
MTGIMLHASTITMTRMVSENDSVSVERYDHGYDAHGDRVKTTVSVSERYLLLT